MNIGDHIKVKNGITDPDFPERELTGYTGCIVGFEYDGIQIKWDRKTLNNMSEDFIELCDKKNLDHTVMGLDTSEVDVIDTELNKKTKRFWFF